MNICKDCRFFSATSDIWYDHHCTHPSVQAVEVIHPQTGKTVFGRKNDLGTTYFTEDPRPYAREINPEGECNLYEARLTARVLGRARGRKT